MYRHPSFLCLCLCKITGQFKKRVLPPTKSPFLGWLPSEHGPGPGEGNVKLVEPQLPRVLIGVVELGALRPVVDRVVMLEDKAQDVLTVGLVFLGVDLVGVPDKIHVVARHKKCLGVLLLEMEIHFVSADAVHVELLISVVGQ